MASQQDFQATCDRLAEHLCSDDKKAQAAAAVTVALMLQSEASAPYAPSADLGKMCEAFCGLIESGDAAIQASRSRMAWPPALVLPEQMLASPPGATIVSQRSMPILVPLECSR